MVYAHIYMNKNTVYLQYVTYEHISLPTEFYVSFTFLIFFLTLSVTHLSKTKQNQIQAKNYNKHTNKTPQNQKAE